MHIAILGAGAIGCYVGAQWSAGQGAGVTLIGRERVLAPLRKTALQADGLTAGPMTLTGDPTALAGADLIAVAVKAHALDSAMEDIARHARPETPILSLLNGLAPVRALRMRFPKRAIIPGMVPFNVVWTGPARLHRSGPGEVAVQRHPLTESLAPVALHDDLAPIQYGKLLLNLVGAINGLSGLPLHAMLTQRGYRHVYAAALAEALAAYRAGGIRFAKVGPTSPRLAIPILRGPDWLFNVAALRRQNLDPKTMTSLATDLVSGKPTEVDVLNGEIVRIGAEGGHPTPVNEALVRLVKAEEGKAVPRRYSAGELMAQIRTK